MSNTCLTSSESTVATTVEESRDLLLTVDSSLPIQKITPTVNRRVLVKTSTDITLPIMEDEKKTLIKTAEANNQYLTKDNYLSEFSTEADKSKARDNLGISGTGSSTGIASEWKYLTDTIKS